MCYTLEMSFYGVRSRGGGFAPRWSPWGSNDEQYRAFGVGLAYSFLDYYGIRRDAESEAVTARVFNAAATGEHAAPERAFGNASAAAEKTELFAARDAPSQGHGASREERDAFLSEKTGLLTEKPWLRGASREERAEKSRSSSRASKSERAAKRAAAAAAAALAKEKAKTERPKSSSRREPRVLASSVRVVGSDMDTDLASMSDLASGKAVASSAGKMVGGVVPPARARRGKRDDELPAASAIRRFSFPAAGSREIKASRTAPASPKRLETPSGPATEPASADASLESLVAPEATEAMRAGGAPESRRTNPNAFGAGGRFRNTSELRNAARVGNAKRAPSKAAAKKIKGGATLLGSFRVPGLGAFGNESEGAAGTAGDGGDAFGIEHEFARAELSE